MHLKNVSGIKGVFFELENRAVTIVTGIFDRKGRAVSDQEDFTPNPPDNLSVEPQEGNTLLLGIHLKHPLIEHLIESTDPYRAYYTLAYLANELSLCQKMLVPYCPFYHLTKERLAADMRKALMNQLLSDSKIT